MVREYMNMLEVAAILSYHQCQGSAARAVNTASSGHIFTESPLRLSSSSRSPTVLT